MAQKYKKLLKRFLKALIIMLLVIVCLPWLLYIPPVQEFVKNAVVAQINKSTDMTVSVERILLRFPLDVNVDKILVLDQNKDTMLCADNVATDVELFPLFVKKISVRKAALLHGAYRMVSQDSSMILSVHAKRCNVADAVIDLGKNDINVNSATLCSGGVKLLLYPEKSKPTPPDTIKSKGWHIKANNIALRQIHYTMRMLPYIECLDADVASASLVDGIVDTDKCYVHAHSLTVDRIDARYIYPTPQYVAQHPLKPDTTKVASSDTTQWTVVGDVVSLSNSHAVYAMNGTRPTQGLDMNYLEASDINLGVHNFFNRGTAVRVPLSKFTARERCGLKISSATGTFVMDSTMMQATDFNINTVLSSIHLNGKIATGFFANDKKSPVNLDLNAEVGIGEIGKLYPSLRHVINNIPQYSPMKVNIALHGNASQINIDRAEMSLPKYVSASVSGHVANVMDAKRIKADVALKGYLGNVNFAKPLVLPSATQKQINIPPLDIKGKLTYSPSAVKGQMTMRMETGKLVFDGGWNGNGNIYAAKLNLNAFPLNAVMPLGSFGTVSATMQVAGRGFNPYSKKTAFKGDVNIVSLEYNNELYQDVTADARLADGRFDVNLTSANEFCDMTLTANGFLQEKHYQFDIKSNVGYIDLQALKLSKTESRGQGIVNAYGDIDLRSQDYDIVMNLKDFNWMLPEKVYFSPEVNVSVESDRHSITAMMEDNDFKLSFSSQCGVDSFIYKLKKSQSVAIAEYKSKSLDMDTLQTCLPDFSCDVTIGSNNLLQQYLEASKIKFKDISLSIYNDSTIYLKGKAKSVKVGETRIDTVTVYANEEGKRLKYAFHIGNAKGTNDAFASVSLSGDIYGNKLTALLNQQNIKKDVGFNIGLNAMLTDSLIDVRFDHYHPIIGYRNWSINPDNNLSYNYNSHHIGANLSLQSDSSIVSLKSVREEGANQDNLLLDIANVQIGEWLNLSPFAPPVKGVLGANVKMKYDGKNFWGGGTTTLNNFTYDDKRVGDFKLNVELDLNPVENYVTLSSDMDVDGHCALVAKGVLNDSTAASPFNVELKVDSFPLSTVTPFIPQGMAQLSGHLSGFSTITGTPKEPLINGSLHFNSAQLYMPMFGSRLKFADTPIAVDSNLVRFDNFAILGSNGNPLAINGTVGLHDYVNPSFELNMKGRSIEFVNSKQNRKSEVFGKGYADISASIVGKLSNIYLNTDISILPSTNLTYVMQTDVSTISTDNNESMVKFVNFTDSTLTSTDSIAGNETFGSYSFDAAVNIQQGAKFNVFLSNDGKNRAQIQGYGNLDFSQGSYGDMRLSGRYTIDKGFVRYSNPIISEKLFNFDSGSYVAWTGDLLNPQLNLKAVETLRANVTQEGQDSRLIDFLVSLSVTNTLSKMDINFDLSTNDDLTVSNELQSMSSSQRSSQAINLLLYNTYTGPGTSSTSNLSGNPLYSFLNSQINQWAANTIKGIDISLGINQYDETRNGTTTTTTSYSYKVSKSLFNDRFKIVVGGNYNPDETSDDNIALGLLNDISFEYKLNESGNMYVRLFRHTGFESILEGEVTEMGVGFVIKKKLSNLKRLFKLGKKKKSGSATVTVENIGLIPTKKRASANSEK